MPATTLTICNKLGLHARAAARLSKLAEQFSADIRIEKDGHSINAKSIMQVMMLAAGKGSDITIHADGSDAEDALAALANLVNNRFDETE
ncbi:MAG TPA: HPr family phosphocarrier protein [Pseudomonadales bacterium]